MDQIYERLLGSRWGGEGASLLCEGAVKAASVSLTRIAEAAALLRNTPVPRSASLLEAFWVKNELLIGEYK